MPSVLNFNGLIPATVLPMTPSGDPDEEALRRYIGWVVDQGVVGVAINADTGESAHLDPREKARILEVVREELPESCMLVAGLTTQYTTQAVAQARVYKKIGADALLVFPISAYLSAPLDPEIPIRYHEAVASVGVPLILFQLQPALGGVSYERTTLERLLLIEGVQALKEASFDARRFAETVEIVRGVEKPVAVLTGNDNFIYESFLLGADGALVGFGSMMIREQVELIELARAREYEQAGALARRVQAMTDVVFAPPVAKYRARLKEALVVLGVLDNATVREPLLPISSHERDALRETLAEVGLAAESAR